MKLHNDYKGFYIFIYIYIYMFIYILFVLLVNMQSNINCEECVIPPVTLDYTGVLPRKSYITSLGNNKCV